MLLAIAIVAFTIGKFAPVSDWGRMMVVEVPPEPVLAKDTDGLIRHVQRYDPPIWLEYARWLGVAEQEDGRFSGVLEGDLGQSLWGDETYH